MKAGPWLKSVCDAVEASSHVSECSLVIDADPVVSRVVGSAFVDVKCVKSAKKGDAKCVHAAKGAVAIVGVKVVTEVVGGCAEQLAVVLI